MAAAFASRRTRKPGSGLAPPLAAARSAPALAAPLASLSAVPALPVVQRKCAACGGSDELPVQARLEVGPVDDLHEREADAVADRVTGAGAPMAAPAITPLPGGRLARKAAGPGPAGGGGDLAGALAGQGPGAPLAPEALDYFEPRFGRDLGHVRVHADAGAGRLAGDLKAQAFTHGSDIYFGAGHYDPASAGGRHLIAHEVAHTFQQGAGQQGEGGAPAVQRKVVNDGKLKIEIDYGNAINIPAAQRPDRAVAAIAAYAGAAPDAGQEAAVRALSADAQEWLIFALDLLADNQAAAPGLDRLAAVSRLIARAPLSANPPLPDSDDFFIHEALEVSGWLESASANGLAIPGAAAAKAVGKVVNPLPTSGSATDPLDEPNFTARLRPALKALLKAADPAKWSSKGTRSLSAFQSLGDIVQAEAKKFFAPYADAAIGNIYSLKPEWKASANIFSTVTMTPSQDERISYLTNRADIVGWTDTATGVLADTNIYADTNYDGSRVADLAARQKVIDAIEADPTFQAIVNRLIQHTGRKSGTGPSTSIGLVTEYNAGSLDACAAHWAGIDTLCHEVLHALVHPNFTAAIAKVRFPQVLREGFTEVLGVDLFNDHVAREAKKHPAFKALLENGVSGAPCKEPDPATVGYGAAGTGAAEIKKQVGPENFKAAYFMGRTDLAGLP